MKHLIRTSSHGNHVSVIDDLSNGLIIKASSTKEGIRRLIKEKEGLSWYGECLGEKESDRLSGSYDLPDYMRLHIKKFSGKKISYKRGFLKNTEALEHVIDHYIATWPQEKTTLVHGDLTLDNVIFTPQGVRFFDWEHFTGTVYPWGFDILYCLLSGLLLPLKPDQLPGKDDYKVFMDLLFKLIDHGLSADLAEYPLSYYRRIFKEDPCWSDIITNSPHKLFPLQYEELYADIVDDQITRRIRHTRYRLWKEQQ